MARNFRNTLLFESAFDTIEPSNQLIYSAAQALFEPKVQVIADNCQTLLGEKIPLTFRAQGYTEAGTGIALSPTAIAERIAAGKKNTYARTIGTCVAEGGVCRVCLAGSRPDLISTPVGTRLSLKSEVILDIARNPTETVGNTFILPYKSTQYDRVQVFLNQSFIPTSSYSIVDDVFTYVGPLQETDIFAFRFLVNSNLPYYYWLAGTYSGSVLGIQPVTKLVLPVRPSILRGSLPQEDIEDIVEQLSLSVVGKDDSVVYLKSVKDPLEKAMLAILLGSVIFSSNP